MSKEIVLDFIKRLDAITKDESKFPLKDTFVNIIDGLKNISVKDQEDIIVRKNVSDLENLLSECQLMSKNREQKKRMKCYSPSEYFYIIKTSIQLKKIRKELFKHSVEEKQEQASKDPLKQESETTLQSAYQWTYGSVDRSKIYGWDKQVDEINTVLLKEDNAGLNMVGIVGNFGTGKTALAQKVFMSDAIMDAFCLRLWVCVSPGCGLNELVRRMLDNLGVEDIDVQDILDANKDKNEVGVLLFLLYVQLMEKRYLIVFDDVCEEQDWQTNLNEQPPEDGEWTDHLAYGLPKESGSAIIVTSKFHEVAKKIVGRTKIYYPDVMEKDNAWLLFQTAYEEVKKFDKNLESMKDKITEKCNGIPLALKMVGKKLALQQTQQDDVEEKGRSQSFTDTDNKQAEEKGGSQSGDAGQSIVDNTNKEDNDDIRSKQEIDNDNAEPKEENTGESKQLEDGKGESLPANNNTKSVGPNKDATQDDTISKEEEGINDTNKTAA
ncbi:Disease resistance rpp13-like protein [Thalictrum thalictroides]|uniref:Disease resistance rpp13-like protein n=1 Tax=Thalictrum thalictroides TaxID=46969 RepID=A0A7J6VDJ4_THATH|nr:Disease resistance rpp13-like protein [Thalictrum thalictroides]